MQPQLWKTEIVRTSLEVRCEKQGWQLPITPVGSIYLGSAVQSEHLGDIFGMVISLWVFVGGEAIAFGQLMAGIYISARVFCICKHSTRS